MKLVVFGATGNIGQRIVREALSRGHEVTGVVRDPEVQKSPDAAVPLVKTRVSRGAWLALEQLRFELYLQRLHRASLRRVGSAFRLLCHIPARA